jgi:hypothetical protein
MNQAEYEAVALSTEEAMTACDCKIDQLRRELAFHLACYHGSKGDDLFDKGVSHALEVVEAQATAFRKVLNQRIAEYEAEHITPVLHAAGVFPPFAVIEGGKCS